MLTARSIRIIIRSTAAVLKLLKLVKTCARLQQGPLPQSCKGSDLELIWLAAQTPQTNDLGTQNKDRLSLTTQNKHWTTPGLSEVRNRKSTPFPRTPPTTQPQQKRARESRQLSPIPWWSCRRCEIEVRHLAGVVLGTSILVSWGA